MEKVLEKFMKRLRDTDGKPIPENVTVLDINNISFHTPLGSKEYVFNVWFKPHTTGLANRKTYSYRIGSIEKCLQIKEMMDKVYNMEEDDLFSDDEVQEDSSLLVTTKESNDFISRSSSSNQETEAPF